MNPTRQGGDGKALDAELLGKTEIPASEDWEDKVAIAKEARALGAKLQKASGNATSIHGVFPRK